MFLLLLQDYRAAVACCVWYSVSFLCLCTFSRILWVTRFIHTESLSKLQWQRLQACGSARVSIELRRFTGPLDPSHKMRPNLLFSFLFGLGLLRNCTPEPRAPSLFTCFYLEEKNKRRPRHKHTGRHVSSLHAPVGWAHRHIHMDAPVRENMGGRYTVTWRTGVRRSWICSAQGTAEMNRVWRGVCMPLDLISPTCPCHSDSQPR